MTWNNTSNLYITGPLWSVDSPCKGLVMRTSFPCHGVMMQTPFPMFIGFALYYLDAAFLMNTTVVFHKRRRNQAVVIPDR